MSDEATQAALREMSSQIGALGATVASMLETWRRQDADATTGRRELRRRVEELTAKLDRVVLRVDNMATELLGIKPTIAAVEIAKQRAIGAGLVGKALWAAAGAAGTVGVWLLSHIK